MSSRRARTLAAALAPWLIIPAAAADDAEVRTIEAPVLDIATAESDLAGAARVEEAPKRIRVTFSASVLFDKDSSQLRGAVRTRLREVAARLDKRGYGTVRVVGYTDNLGSTSHGLDLSQRRAAAVSKALRPLLGPGYRFRIEGKGEADPVASNDTEAGRQKNRRVVLTFTPANPGTPLP